MVEDLRKQASQLYRQETEKSELPTSESLSMKKVYLVALALAVVALAAFAVVGTMKPRRDAITTAMTPPPLVKEAPPPELMEDPQPTALKQQADGLPSAKADAKDVFEPPAPAPEPPKAVAQPKAPPPESAPARETVSASRPGAASSAKPVLKRETATPSQGRKGAEARAAAAEPPAPPPVPEISPEEKARRELARDIVVQKTPSFAELLIKNPKQEWKADPEPGGTYLVSFTLPDRTTGQPVLYVWRVDVTSRAVTPLSYHARSLP